MSGLTLNSSMQILSSIDDCEFRGSTQFANYYRFENSYELALELNEQTTGTLTQISIWLSNIDTIGRFIGPQTHARLFEKWKNRSKYLGNRIFARSLRDSCEAVRLQISNEYLFRLIIDTYRGVIKDTSYIDIPITDNQSTEIETISQETDLNFRIVDYLRSHPNEINKAIDESGRTPLIYAVQSKDFNLVKQLIELGAGLKVQDKNGQTALDYASIQGEEFIQEFKEKVFPKSELVLTNQETNESKNSRKKNYLESVNEVTQSLELTGENLYESDFDERIDETEPPTKLIVSDFLTNAQVVPKTKNKDDLCNQLKKLKISKKLKLVYFGLKSGWSRDQVKVLLGDKYIENNSFLIDLLDKYFENYE